MAILEKLYKSEDFTPTEQSIIQYLLENVHLISEMTIQQFALATHSSNAAIIRICKKLGYTGYKDFKLALAIELASSKFIDQTINFSTPFYQSETTREIINDLSSLYRETIQIIQSHINISDIENISHTMSKSQRIFIFAAGDSRITAMNFINKLMKINIYPILATENYEEIAMAYNMTSHDCALFISYTGINERFISCTKILNRKNIPILTLTANEESPLLSHSTLSIIIPHKENNYKIGTFYSQISFQFILTILYSLIYKDDYARHHQHKMIIDSQTKR